MTHRDVTYRVVWVPGTDELVGVCHCGAEHVASSPVEIWAWLLGHPQGHAGAGSPADGALDVVGATR